MNAFWLHRYIWQRALPVLGRQPALYAPFSRWRYGSNLAFGAQTEIVIEGFPRSANSFAVNAFAIAQGRPVHIAHHLHAPAQVIAATRAGVPAVVLIRDPRDAIVSYLLWQPHVDARRAARNYLNFYRTLTPLHSAIVVADFHQVTTDFGAVITNVNRRFGTDFARFEHTQANVQRCFGEIENDSRIRRGTLDESVVARPSEHRRGLKRDVETEFLRQTTPSLRGALDAVYADFRAFADASGC